jgi:hypothetical protein
MVFPPRSTTLMPQSLPWDCLFRTWLMDLARADPGVEGTNRTVCLPPFLNQFFLFMSLEMDLSSLCQASGLLMGLTPVSSRTSCLLKVARAPCSTSSL